jgi:hypothetical protein
MNRSEDSLIAIARRRERLVARAGAHRAAIAGTFFELQEPAAIADRALGVARFLRAHPLLTAAGVAVAAVALRRPGVLTLAGRALAVWRLWRTISVRSSRRSA